MSKQESHFVVQEHTTADGVHWDLMLEAGGVLQTWRLDRRPEELLRAGASAERIFDHPLKFLTYEGPVQDGKGTVRIIDKGVCETLSRQGNPAEFLFAGAVLKGCFTMTPVKGRNGGWELCRSQ